MHLDAFLNKALIPPSVGPEVVVGGASAQCPSFLSMIIIVDHAAASDVNYDVNDDDNDDVNDDDDVNGTHSALLADDANAVSQVFTRVASHIMPELCWLWGW